MVDHLKLVPRELAKSPTKELAKCCWELYAAFRDVGFNQDQAFKLMRDRTSWYGEIPISSPPDEIA